MNADLENLIVLQAQDLELGRLRAEVAEAPRRVAQAEAAAASAAAGLGRLEASLGAEDKLRRGQDLEQGTLRTKLERLRRSLDGASSAQQVAAFEREIAFTEQARTQLDEEAFASLERTEQAEMERENARAALGSAQTALETTRTNAAALITRNRETIAGVEGERLQLRNEISPARLASYDRLVKTRGTAVAEALGDATAGKCAACQMGVRPQRWQDLIGRDHLDEIFSCESCGRMLFWDPRRDTPRAWAAGERLNSANSSNSAKPGAVPAATGGAAR